MIESSILYTFISYILIKSFFDGTSNEYVSSRVSLDQNKNKIKCRKTWGLDQNCEFSKIMRPNISIIK